MLRIIRIRYNLIESHHKLSRTQFKSTLFGQSELYHSWYALYQIVCVGQVNTCFHLQFLTKYVSTVKLFLNLNKLPFGSFIPNIHKTVTFLYYIQLIVNGFVEIGSGRNAFPPGRPLIPELGSHRDTESSMCLNTNYIVYFPGKSGRKVQQPNLRRPCY